VSDLNKSRIGRVLGLVTVAALLAIPPTLLAWLALPRFSAGLAMLGAPPIVSQRLAGAAITPSMSMEAEHAFSRALASDGESELWRAELLAVRASRDVLALKEARTLALDGLSKYPASPRGWTVLCEIEIGIERSKAAECMDTAFYVGPFDWFVVKRRTLLAAYLWPQLDRDTQEAAARQLKRIWEDQRLRTIAYDASREPNGAGLVSAAFHGDTSTMSAFERGLATVPAQRKVTP